MAGGASICDAPPPPPPPPPRFLAFTCNTFRKQQINASGVSRISARGVLKLRPDTKSGGGAVGFWPGTKSGGGGGGVLSASGPVRKAGGGGGGGGVLSVSGPVRKAGGGGCYWSGPIQARI